MQPVAAEDSRREEGGLRLHSVGGTREMLRTKCVVKLYEVNRHQLVVRKPTVDQTAPPGCKFPPLSDMSSHTCEI